jgi:hypothetical protein
MFDVNFRMTTKVDRVQKMVNDILKLTNKQVLVGVPDDKNQRKEGPIGNAALAYIHDKGSPLQGIPARPFMEPGINQVQDRINTHMLATAKAELEGDQDKVDRHLSAAGMIAQNSIKRVINEGVGFAPIKRSTALARLRKRKGADKWSKEKREDIIEGMQPLVATGQLRNSITYVVADKE